MMRLGLWTLLLSVMAFGYWAYETELPHVVRSEIIIEPAGEVQQIQHPDGGTLAELLVRSGDQVEAGRSYCVSIGHERHPIWMRMKRGNAHYVPGCLG